eukprot:909419_1
MGSALYKFRFANIQHLNIITNISNIYLIDAKGHYTEGAELIYETQGFQLTQSTGGGMDGLNGFNAPTTPNPTSAASNPIPVTPYPSQTADSDTKNGGTLIISPISSSPKDINPSNKENIDELNPISNNNNNNLQNQKPTCSLPIVPKINKNMNINTNKILPSLPPNIITTSTNTINSISNTSNSISNSSTISITNSR